MEHTSWITLQEIMITSIAFNLIIIRVAKLRKEESKLAPFRGDLTLTSIRFATSERCESSDNREEGIDLDIEGDPRGMFRAQDRESSYLWL